MELEKLAKKLRNMRLKNCFNPWQDICRIHDYESSPEIRFRNLLSYLSAMNRLKPSIAIIGEAAGYRGMRRTGFPISSEKLLLRISDFLGVKLEKATKTEGMGEITASVVWDFIFRLKKPVLLWNAFMLHPHKGDGMSNRSPTRNELRRFKLLLKAFLDYFEPEIIVAMGKSASFLLSELNFEFFRVRHPAHGGAGKFRKEMEEITGACKSTA